ncbi:MAG: Xaa-Pro aminopeptidase [Tidjanibacter sp.]|nr:Xaa-Pro aminopeptidase [Tidjanibacter sp.]
MFSSKTYFERRNTLRQRMPKGGIVLLPGNSEAPRNYFDNAYDFRQDSNFLYYFGLDMPDFVGVIDLDSGEATLFGDDLTVNDIVWTGPQPSVSELAASVGVTNTAPLADARKVVTEAVRKGRKVHYLVPYRGDNTLLVSRLTGIKTTEHYNHYSTDLAIKIAAMREVKSAEEIEALERAFEIGYAMHTTAMKMTREGVGERMIAGAMEGVTHQLGAGVSFHSIVSQHGETLHNHSHDGICTNGRLLLCDAGGETTDNYCSDHTRTYPVSGRFSPVQKEVYNIVLASHDEVLRTAKPGPYTDIHLTSYRILAEGLTAMGLMKGNPADAVEAGAVALFMPHGLGHGLGMDVHDCESMGERGMADFEAMRARAAEIDTCILRSSWRVRPGTVMSDEPGIYFIPTLVEQWKAAGKCKEFIDFERLKEFYDFGGIRIEDDILITENGCRQIGRDKHIPVTVEEIESFMAH